MSAGNSGNLIMAAHKRAQSLQDQGQSVAKGGNSHMGREVDLVSGALRDLVNGGKNLPATSRDAQNAYLTGLVSAIGPDTDYGKAFVAEAQSSFQQAMDLAANKWNTVTQADGLLAKAGAGMTLLTGMEQMLSGPFSLIKFPAMPAVRVLDFALGLPHGHMHPPTYGVPLPSIGPVIPLPWGLSGAENVTINGRAAARCGDMGIGVWCGGYFPIYEILLGSSSVWIEGARAARQGVDLTFHCMMSRLPGKDSPTTGIPLGFLITASDNVIIGGFPLPSLLSLLMAGAFNLLGRGLGKLVGLARRAARKAGREAAERAAREAAEKGETKAARNAARMPLKSRLRSWLCKLTGHPVDIASGRVFTTQTDFKLPGRIPIEFTRIYDTSAIDYEGPLGWGWMHPFDMHLWVDDGQDMVIMRNEEALLAGFNLIAIGERDFNPLEEQWLERLDENIYVISDRNKLRYRFSAIKTNEPFSEGKSENTALRLIEIEDQYGYRIDLFYEGGRLGSLKDAAGNRINFSYITLENGAARLAGIGLVLDEKSTRTARLVNFAYDAEGRLVSATDRGLVPWRYAYDGHLLIRETNRNGVNFHFAYRGEGHDVKCVHTWGDGGIYERWIDYDSEARMTVVEDSLGKKATYFFNEFYLAVRIIDALGGEKRFKYGSNGELLSQTDEIGRTTKYKYDSDGNCIRVIYPDQVTRRFGYTSDSLVERLTDEAGAEFRRVYDQYGKVSVTSDALGNRNEYYYDQRGDLVRAVDPLGGVTKFKWNERGQLVEFITPLGTTTRYGYDERGRLVWVSDPLGNTRRYAYDSLDRLAQVERPDGIKHRYQYDPEGNLTRLYDGNGTETRFRYVHLNKLGERIDALGYTRRLIYDTEANLIELNNERGEAYKFTYDALDRVIREIGFDGSTWEYDYDSVGHLITRVDPAKRTTRFAYDLHGRVIERHRPDGAIVKFGYDRVGRLTEAAAPGSELVFRYDALGQVTHESQNGQIIEHKYDPLGRRIERRSPSGQTIKFIYDADGQMNRCATGCGSIEFEYDKAGRMVKKRTPSDLEESFHYDRCGRVIEQSLHRLGQMLFLRGYKYDNEGNLIEMNDSKKGTSRFTYDPVDRLQEVLRPEKKVEQFVYDSTGNLLRRGKRKFSYDQPDRLTTTNDIRLIHDEIGNLIEKRSGGSVIHYSYDADNQLTAIESKEGGLIEFIYDAFGRRIAKKTKDGETGFLWDGDVLLAEQRGERSNEYIFEPESFVPLCRFDGNCFEVYQNDHLGTPQELTNERGQFIWSAVYDVYGHISKLEESQTDNQIRFQGQYEDYESGLYYNYYRYYDPESGRYITKDPLGLMGGQNLYEYSQNPINWIDPLGLKSTFHRGSGHSLVDRFVDELESAVTHSNRALDLMVKPKKTGGPPWVRKYRKVLNGEDDIPERLARGNAVQQLADRIVARGAAVRDLREAGARVLFNSGSVTGMKNTKGNLLRPDYQIVMRNGDVYVLDITTGGESINGKIFKYDDRIVDKNGKVTSKGRTIGLIDVNY